jgi:hypothetical protein
MAIRLATLDKAGAHLKRILRTTSCDFFLRAALAKRRRQAFQREELDRVVRSGDCHRHRIDGCLPVLSALLLNIEPSRYLS